jgi:hypothetical protein
MWVGLFLALLAVLAAYKGWSIYKEIRRIQERDGTIDGIKDGWKAGLEEQRTAFIAQGMTPDQVDAAMERFEAAARARGLDPETKIKRMEEAGEI